MGETQKEMRCPRCESTLRKAGPGWLKCDTCKIEVFFPDEEAEKEAAANPESLEDDYKNAMELWLDEQRTQKLLAKPGGRSGMKVKRKRKPLKHICRGLTDQT